MDKHREEEQTQQQQQQQQKEVGKADASSNEQQAFVVPVDPTLLQYIDECIHNIRPLPTTQEQAAALARSFNGFLIS